MSLYYLWDIFITNNFGFERIFCTVFWEFSESCCVVKCTGPVFVNRKWRSINRNPYSGFHVTIICLAKNQILLSVLCITNFSWTYLCYVSERDIFELGGVTVNWALFAHPEPKHRAWVEHLVQQESQQAQENQQSSNQLAQHCKEQVWRTVGIGTIALLQYVVSALAAILHLINDLYVTSNETNKLESNNKQQPTNRCNFYVLTTDDHLTTKLTNQNHDQQL